MSTATCPDCGTTVTLNPSGTLRRHRAGGVVCGAADTGAVVGLPWTKPLTQNQVRRMHPLAEARVKKQMSSDARWLIRAAKIAPVQRAHVTLHYRPGTRRPCDADGLAPTLKVALDAIVRENVLPDDDYRHVPKVSIEVHEPHDGMPASFWVEVTELGRPA